MKVAVLGAAGTIAPAIVRDLADSAEIDEILLLDLDGARAGRVGDVHGGGKATARQTDARGALAAELDDVDLLINAASYRVNLDAMRACLAAGAHYADLGGLYWMTQRQLELHTEFERGGLLALLGIGSSPGKTNVMARWAVRELDAVESIDVVAAGRDARPPGGLSVPYALETLVDELTMRPVILRDGESIDIEPLRAGGAVDFGEPIGVAETIYTLHSELATFGPSFGCATASFRLSLAPALLERLRQLVGASPETIASTARDTVPASGETTSVHLIDARGGGRRVRARAVTRPHVPFAMGGSVVSTAAPAAAAARLLARGRIDTRGARPPEDCIEPRDLFAELETRSCSFDIEIFEEVEVA